MRPRYQLIAVAWLASVAAIPSTYADEATRPQQAADANETQRSPEIVIWINELDDDRYLVREQATRKLQDAGPAVLDPLLAAANGQRPEPADRAIWILQKLGRNDDLPFAMAALTRLVQLRNRPHLVMEAQVELARISLMVCQRNLEALGAEVSAQLEQIVPLGAVGLVVQVRLGEKWRGETEDLRPLAEETFHQFFRLEGEAINDAVVKLFESKENLGQLQLVDTKVSVAGVDSLKALRPNAIVYMRNDALLGVAAENHAFGVAVRDVPAGTAAAGAGIQAGDVILSLDGHPLPDFDRLTSRIAQHKPGDKIQVAFQRGQEKKTIEVTLGSWAGQR